MPVITVDGSRFTLAQLKERGDRAIARAREVFLRHETLSREVRELHAEIDQLHHMPKAVHT